MLRSYEKHLLALCGLLSLTLVALILYPAVGERAERPSRSTCKARRSKKNS